MLATRLEGGRRLGRACSTILKEEGRIMISQGSDQLEDFGDTSRRHDSGGDTVFDNKQNEH